MEETWGDRGQSGIHETIKNTVSYQEEMSGQVYRKRVRWLKPTGNDGRLHVPPEYSVCSGWVSNTILSLYLPFLK